jgi:hypothetical protein
MKSGSLNSWNPQAFPGIVLLVAIICYLKASLITELIKETNKVKIIKYGFSSWH